MEVEVGVLGALRVVVRDVDVTPTAPKEKSLLALLVVERGQVVSTDRLLEELWPDLPPPRARRVLQVRVAAVRKALDRAGGAPLLESVPPGYRVRLDPGSLDGDRFEVLLEQARAAATAGKPETTAAMLGEGASLWRGEPYADARGSITVEIEAERLADLRLAAMEERLTAQLALGCHAQVAPALEALIAAHPLRERLWENWVLALYRCGRQAEALRACAAIRARLRDELGVTPGAGLRELEAALLDQRADLDLPPRPGSARQPADPTVVGPPAAGPDGSGPPADRGRTSNVPAVDPLVGRAVDVRRVADLLRAHRLVTVSGPGGVGKSHLAMAVANDVRTDWAGGVWLVELAPVSSASDLLGAVAGAVPLPVLAATAAELFQAIGTRPILVVLDNCEHLVDDVAVLVSHLLATCPMARVLCTSREPLAVHGEHLWPLQPLSTHDASVLFFERAGAVRPDIDLDPAVVTDIVQRLDGLPLAIELAAAKVASLSAGEIAAQLDRRFDLLTAVVRGGPPRHRALRAMVDWSHDLLEPEQRTVLRRLAIFSGGFTRQAAAHVAGGGPGTADAPLHLDRLVRRSLVEADISGGHTRYRLLETLRQYGAERLAEAGEALAIGRRHAEWYAERALELDAVGSPDETAVLAAAVWDFPNIRAAVAFALAQRDTDLAVSLVDRLWPLTVLWRAEQLDWARAALALPGAEHHPEVGHVHVVVANLATILGHQEESERACDEALRRPLHEDAWTSAVLTRASLLGYRGDKEAGVQVRAAIEAATRPKNRILLQALLVSGEGFAGLESHVDTARLVREADETRIPAVRTFARAMVAIALVGRGRSADAITLLHEAGAINQPGLNRRSVGLTAEMLALAAGAPDGSPATEDLADRAAQTLVLCQEYPLALGFALIGLHVSADRQGRHEDAAVLAGYLTANLLGLAVPPRGADLMAGAPLERFADSPVADHYLRGRSMSAAELHRYLEGLAAVSAGPGAPGTGSSAERP